MEAALPDSNRNTIIAKPKPQQAQIRICENPDGTFCLQTRDAESDWHTAYEGADNLSRAEAVYAMEMWRNGLGYADAPEVESCDAP